jgi:threonine-phosphate decarboxylase
MALHLRAFTKSFAVPGLRAGYMISHDTGRLGAVARHLPEWNMSVIAERAGEAAAEILRDTDYLAESLERIEAEREYLTAELRNLGLRVYESDTNYMLFESRPDLYDRLLEKGILIRKCANFSGLDESFFRIAVRTHEDNEELVSALAEVLK